RPARALERRRRPGPGRGREVRGDPRHGGRAEEGARAVTRKTYDVEQGTEEWHDVRRGILTASVVGQLITTKTLKPAANDISRGLTATLVAERITGWTEPTYTSDDMMRGILDEPLARDLYSEHFAPVRECGFMVLTLAHGERLGYSPDGIVGADGLIEVKSRKPKKHLATILADEVPP